MRKIRNGLLLVLGGFVVLLLQVAVIQLTHQADAQSVSECPTGSYEIDRRDGKPLCKLEPTGCPYGDSIPLDSPKCAPSTAEEIEAASPQTTVVETVEPETTEMVGK